jgi:hypothetical protein
LFPVATIIHFGTANNKGTITMNTKPKKYTAFYAIRTTPDNKELLQACLKRNKDKFEELLAAFCTRFLETFPSNDDVKHDKSIINDGVKHDELITNDDVKRDDDDVKRDEIEDLLSDDDVKHDDYSTKKQQLSRFADSIRAKNCSHLL